MKKINILKHPFQLGLGHVCQFLRFLCVLHCFKEKSFWFANHLGRAKCLLSLLPPLLLPNKMKYNNNKNKTPQYLLKKSLPLKLAVTLRRILSKNVCFYSIGFVPEQFLVHEVCLLQGICFLPECFWAIRRYMWAHWSLVYVYNVEQCCWRTYRLVTGFYVGVRVF